MPNRVAPKLDLEYLRERDWWRHVDRRKANECWPWLRSVGSHGYGQTWDGITVRVAHRVAWSLANDAQIPPGHLIDHACRNALCCNPRHLRLIANERDGTRLTHCPNGHEYTPENIIWKVRKSNGNPIRRCRICHQAAWRRWYHNRKER